MFAYTGLTGVMMYSIGEHSLRGRLPIGLGWHAGETVYANGGGDAGHCGGTDARRSTATCRQRSDGRGRERETVSDPPDFLFSEDRMERFLL